MFMLNVIRYCVLFQSNNHLLLYWGFSVIKLLSQFSSCLLNSLNKELNNMIQTLTRCKP